MIKITVPKSDEEFLELSKLPNTVYTGSFHDTRQLIFHNRRNPKKYWMEDEFGLIEKHG